MRRLGVDAGLAICVVDVAAVAHQPTEFSKFAPLVYRGNRPLSGQRDELISLAIEKRIAAYEKRSRPLLDKRRKGRVEVALGVGPDDMNLPSKCARGVDHVSRFLLKVGTRRIREHCDQGGRGH